MKPKQITDISYDTPSYRKSPPLNVLKLRRGSEPVAILSYVLDMQYTGGDMLIFYFFYYYPSNVSCSSFRLNDVGVITNQYTEKGLLSQFSKV